VESEGQLRRDIREGDVDGTDVGGLRVAAIIDTPRGMTDRNSRLGVFLDSRATEDVRVFLGRVAA
jgi:hypothetical protein